MKIRKHLNIAWVGNRQDEFIVVDSKEISATSCAEASERIQQARFVDGFLPTVILDQDLDSPELRSLLQSKAIERFTAAKTRATA